MLAYFIEAFLDCQELIRLGMGSLNWKWHAGYR